MLQVVLLVSQLHRVVFVEEILDILGWETPELVDALEDHIKELEEEFKQAVR